MSITLETARTILAAALKAAGEHGFKPLTVVVLDAGAVPVALERQDGASRLRPDIAIGKANGALALGMGSRAIFKRATEQPYFIQSMNALCNGSLVPVPGGVLVRESAGGRILGAVGITGDTSDNDEIAAIAGIEAAGLVADAG
ncbi:heme-binding protein [Aurantimonas sp. Leaf443]|uniref:GlcG/HbpS family heme-binding protein n=1 Tax=Aurantimonas sp. Leaf443 TaxID=1736378 RepID=UPI0006F99BDC|nr:heme-binding protein [Aurantimonas sp. Leaf443]KQT87521.1 GlcG protein [Aurantimonas sp. Leaf443]